MQTFPPLPAHTGERVTGLHPLHPPGPPRRPPRRPLKVPGRAAQPGPARPGPRRHRRMPTSTPHHTTTNTTTDTHPPTTTPTRSRARSLTTGKETPMHPTTRPSRPDWSQLCGGIPPRQWPSTMLDAIDLADQDDTTDRTPVFSSSGTSPITRQAPGLFVSPKTKSRRA